MKSAEQLDRGCAVIVRSIPHIALERSLVLTSIVALVLSCRAAPESKARVHVASAADLARSYGLELRPDASDGVTIRVVDASNKPVPDALVVSVNESEFTYWDAGDGGRTWNARSLLKHSGQAYATSGDGLARVATPTEPWPRAIFVWHGDDFGRTTLEVFDRAEHVVSIAPRSLLVEVVDKNGKPQPGVPIQLGKCALAPMSLGTTVGITGPDGRFAIPALELERGVHRTCGRRVLVMLGWLVSGYQLRAIDSPQLEPVKFVLPDCGAVDIQLESKHPWPPSQDHPSWPRFSMSVRGNKHGERCGLYREFEVMSERSLLLPIDQPPYRLEHVEVGTALSFYLNAQLNESSSTSEELEVFGAHGKATMQVDGPSRAGEIEHVHLKSETLGAPPRELSSSDEAESQVERADDRAREEDQPRDQELEDRLRVLSSIDIAVQVDVPIEACWLSARLDDDRNPTEHDSCPWIDVNGRATMRGIPAGKHTVTITERRMSVDEKVDVPLCQIDDVQVEPSQHLRDPRLLNIDLRGKLRVHRYEITDGDGHPLSGFIRFTRVGDPEFADQVWFNDGHVAFLTAVDDDLRATVAVNRFRKQALDLTSIEPVGAPRRLFMEHGIGIRLQLDSKLALPKSPQNSIYIGVSEMPHWFERLDDLRTVELRPDAELRFHLAEPGDWKVIFLQSQDDRSGELTVSRCESVDTTISVENTGAEVVQYLQVKPDPEKWNELLRSLGEAG